MIEETNPVPDLPPIQINTSYVDQHGNVLDPVLVERAQVALLRAEAKRERKRVTRLAWAAAGGFRQTARPKGWRTAV